MIVPDINLLIYAYNDQAPWHPAARTWWEEALSGARPVGIPWVVTLGFIRLMTSPSVTDPPLEPARALAFVREWLRQPNVSVLEPGPRHLSILEDQLDELGVAGRLTTDAHLAAIAIEHQAELYSNDADFARFSGLRWRNPLR